MCEPRKISKGYSLEIDFHQNEALLCINNHFQSAYIIIIGVKMIRKVLLHQLLLLNNTAYESFSLINSL